MMRHAQAPARRQSRQIMVGNVPIGGDAPISVQTMTNTETTDVDATLAQIRRMQTAGVDIVRVSVPSQDAAAAFKQIRAQVDVPLVAKLYLAVVLALVASFAWMSLVGHQHLLHETGTACCAD